MCFVADLLCLVDHVTAEFSDVLNGVQLNLICTWTWDKHLNEACWPNLLYNKTCIKDVVLHARNGN